MNGWIGVDLDGTLAEYTEWKGARHIGEPIPLMLARVRKWLGEGKEVKIFTARVSMNNPERMKSISAIYDWCIKHIGRPLEVTAEKDYGMIELWDDRCKQVLTNTGVAIEDAIDIDAIHSLQR
jgi:hypothetical protein